MFQMELWRGDMCLLAFGVPQPLSIIGYPHTTRLGMYATIITSLSGGAGSREPERKVILNMSSAKKLKLMYLVHSIIQSSAYLPLFISLFCSLKHATQILSHNFRNLTAIYSASDCDIKVVLIRRTVLVSSSNFLFVHL